MDFFQIASILLSLIVLISFFRISAKLSDIKQLLTDFKEQSRRSMRHEQNANYQLNRMLGKNREAIENLTFLLMFDLTDGVFSKLETRAKYDDFKKKNENKFITLGGVFPEYPFEEY